MNMEVIDNYAFSHEIGHFWIGFNIKYSSKGYYFLSESINDQKIIEAANRAGIVMALTGTRHFKH